MSDETKSTVVIPPSDDGETSGRKGGPLSLLFPSDASVWKEARKLVSDKNLRVEDLATCAAQDPAVVLDLLKTANAMYFSGGKSAITSTKTAIVRLGSDVVVDVLEKMKGRPIPESESVQRWFEIHRSRCRRTGIVARILSEALARTLADDCQTSALLLFIGEMIAVMHFKEEYVKLADELSRSGVIYRLAQEQKFDVESVGLTYLRRFGIPDTVLSAIDRDGRPRQQDRAIMKPLCFSAAELVDAFDQNRWEKLAPGKSLPPKSALRSMQIPDSQYLKIYERCSEYLFSVRLLEERRKTGEPVDDLIEEQPIDLGGAYSEQDALQDEIANLLRGSAEIPATSLPQTQTAEPPLPPPPPPPPPPEERDSFSIEAARNVRKTEARVSAALARPVSQPVTHLQRAKNMLLNFDTAIESAKSSEDLIKDLLQMLVDRGPFQKSALIVVSKDRKKAMVVAARGPNIGNGQKLTIDDPLSPLAQCFSKIQSFGTRESANSPFGSKSYALAPIDADHDTPVALYADCGDDAVPFEARRIFRVVVEMLNQKLPQIAGGIPIEVS